MDKSEQLEKLLANLNPSLNEGEYIFASMENISSIPAKAIIAMVREKEGITVVLSRDNADSLNLKYNFIASWITLNVNSELDAIGLTAVFSNALAQQNISCNVIAGYFHDHIFVGKEDGKRALKILKGLGGKDNK